MIPHVATGQWECVTDTMWNGVPFTLVRPCMSDSGPFPPDMEVIAISDHGHNPGKSGLFYTGTAEEFVKLFRRIKP